MRLHLGVCAACCRAATPARSDEPDQSIRDEIVQALKTREKAIEWLCRKLHSPLQDHDIVSQAHQPKIAAAGMTAASRCRHALPSFHQAHHRFRLASLVVFRSVQRLSNLPSVSAAGRISSGTAVVCRHMACNSDDIAGEFVIRLRIVSGVSDDIVDSRPLRGFPDKPSEFVHVRSRTVAGRIGQNHAIAVDAELGKPAIGHVLYGDGAFRLASDGITAGMVRVEAGRIDSDRFDVPTRIPSTDACALSGSQSRFERRDGTR